MMKQPILIAGPCSAESKEQVLAIAEQIKDIPNLQYFRAGIWKPRTRPDAFEGVGAIGLDWLSAVKSLYNIPTATEVANAHHVELCLKAGIDMLWIGARSTTSPFTVQEIAEALKGTNIPIFVKNPVNPDVKLWIGGVERILKMGNNNVGVIHRGFSVYEKKKYRNEPQWQIPIDLQKEFPNIPIICDPSHIGGDSKYIHEISQKAMNFNFDGLMIETHINPSEAWSDAMQQVTPQHLKDIINTLEIRSAFSDEQSLSELKYFRELIIDLDIELMQILEKRMSISEKMGVIKKNHNMVIYQKEIWEQNLSQNIANALSKYNLSESFISNLYKLIHQESIKIQQHIYLNNQTKV